LLLVRSRRSLYISNGGNFDSGMMQLGHSVQNAPIKWLKKRDNQSAPGWAEAMDVPVSIAAAILTLKQ